MLQFGPVFERARIVANMQWAGRANPSENAPSIGHRSRYGAPNVSCDDGLDLSSQLNFHGTLHSDRSHLLQWSYIIRLSPHPWVTEKRVRQRSRPLDEIGERVLVQRLVQGIERIDEDASQAT